MGKKKFERLLLKNTLAVALPAAAVFIVLIFMFIRYPIFENIECKEIGNIENVNERIALLFDEGTTNVKYIAKNLYYTGFDYYVDNKLKGAYYYSLENEQLIFFLVKTENPRMNIEQVELKGKIIKDSMSTNHIMNQFALENDIDYELLREFSSEYIISELDYPYSYIMLVYIFFALPIIICVLILIYAILVWTNPAMHVQSRQLAEYGSPAAIIEELNLQLKNHLIFKKSNIYITEDYMIVNYFTKTDVIKLDYIKFLSKDIIEKQIIFRNKTKIYRLTMSNPEKMFYEVDFVSENLINDIVDYIRGMNNIEKKEN